MTARHRIRFAPGLVAAAVSLALHVAPVPAAPLWADDTESATPVSTGECCTGSLLFRTTAAGPYLRAPVLETDVVIDVTGVVARAVVRQSFRNPHDRWLEGTYVLPLPEDSAVDAMRFVVGERVIEGEIERASLMEPRRLDPFTTRVADVGPGEVVDVVIEYQQQLCYDSGRYTLRFPMVVNPSCSPGGGQASVDGSPRVHDDGAVLGPVNLAVRLDPGMPVTDVDSPSHRLQVTKRPGGGLRVEPAAGLVPADRDFVLSWRPERGDEPRAALFRQTFGGETYLLLWIVPPSDAVADRRRLPRETIFVLDRSGSMAGPSMRQARRALLDALKRLPPDDTFNLVAFSDDARKLFEQAVPAVEPHLTTARRYVEGLSAGGGTEMLRALDMALADGESAPRIAAEGRVRQVIFVTDGSVANEEQIFEHLENRLGDRRLFTAGIGSAASGNFLRRAAELGRGSHVFISRPEDVAQSLGELFARIEAPVLSDLSVRFDDPAAEVYPQRVGDLYLSEPLVVVARTASGMSAVQVEGWRGEVPWIRELSVDGSASGVAVHQLWARRKIESHQASVLPLHFPAGWRPPTDTLPRTTTAARFEIGLGLMLLVLASWFGHRLVWHVVWRAAPRAESEATAAQAAGR